MPSKRPFHPQLRPTLRLVALLLLPLQAATLVPRHVSAAILLAAEKPVEHTMLAISAIPPDPTAGVQVNRTLPILAPAKAATFSAEPTDDEFFSIRVFAEPLVPSGGTTTAAENKALAAAIDAFRQSGNAEQTDSLTAFLAAFPASAWRASLLANLGAVYRSTGYWSRALEAWEESWKVVARETEPRAKAVGDYVAGELAQLNARLGRFEWLESFFHEIEGRDVRGPATERLAGARQGLALMRDRPQDAFRCGPMALERILRATKKDLGKTQLIFDSKSSVKGISLTQVRNLATQLGMKYQLARRSPGAKVIFPAVVNWKVGHYAALTRENQGKFLAQDPTFADDVWVTTRALDEESSGYFLVPAGKLPAGWTSVSDAQGNNVWGKGNAGANSKPPPPGIAPTIKCSSDNRNMADYNVDLARVSLSFTDTPMGYSPPIGPGVYFTLSYQQREIGPASTPTFSNVGNKWGFNWISYLAIDPNNEAADAVTYGPGGGTLDYSGFDTATRSYRTEPQTQIHLVKTDTDRYERRLPDGSKQIFSLSDNAVVYPRKLFMTEAVDPHGNKLTYLYDGSLRLVGLKDALDQVTTLSYELGADPLKITKVTDPFGRRALLQYNSAGQLWKITDTIGIVSEFTYGAGDFITRLTTPYGTTKFAMGETGDSFRWVEITDPQGERERVEYRNDFGEFTATGVPSGDIQLLNQYMNFRNTYYWDKKAMAEAAGDYSKARLTHWLHMNDINVASDVAESEKAPLENRVWFNYPGQPLPISVGSGRNPTRVARVLDDGTTQLYKYEYNSFGKVTKSIDPLGRSTTYVYDANDIDLLEVRQTTGGISELLASYTYNSQHQPLTSKDASGETTVYTYKPNGQLETVTNAKQETTTWAYYPDGYLHTVTGAVPGAVTEFSYDGFGRLRTITDSEGYTVTTTYEAVGGDPARTLNRAARTTYPDGTYEEVTYDRLDPEWMRDRLGRWSRNFYDSQRRLVATQDPLNRIVSYDWCGCGSLEGITDGAGNKTTWVRDIQGRVIDKLYADHTGIHYTYENKTSRLKSTTDAKNQVTNYSYFLDNNLKQVSYTSAQVATPTVTYSYDPVYNRISKMTDGIGDTIYHYNPITVPPALGAGMVASINGPLENDTLAYGYDALRRTNSRSINGAANTSSMQFDALGRVDSITNALGTFGYAYVNTTGRVDHINLPNGQKSQFLYFDNIGNQMLKQIKHLDPSGAIISQFDYTYNAVAKITTWAQANPDTSAPKVWKFGYDAGDQVRSANSEGSSNSAGSGEYAYHYDPAANRTSGQAGTSVTRSVPNKLNQLTAQSGGGLMHVRGRVDEPATVTVAGKTATVDSVGNFESMVPVTPGLNTVPIVARDATGNSRINNYQVNVQSGTDRTLYYDRNGNLTSDGNKTYKWDAANRLVAINYNGTAKRSEFTYDGFSRRVRIVERNDLNVESVKNIVWAGTSIAEEHDSTYLVVRRYFEQGEIRTDGGEAHSYFYSRDHLRSIREMTDEAGVTKARYDYDVYGITTRTSGSLDADFAYTGHYLHAASHLYLAPYRAYEPLSGRWLSRDPIEEQGGVNIYGYVHNDPVNQFDPTGLKALSPDCLAAVLAAIAQANYVLDILAKYDPLLDSIPWPHRWGGSTSPGGHFKKLQQAQQGLRKRIRDAYNKCKDDCEPGSPSSVPGWVRDAAFRRVEEPTIPSAVDNILINIPGSDAAWNNAGDVALVTGAALTVGAAVIMTGGGALVLIPAL